MPINLAAIAMIRLTRQRRRATRATITVRFCLPRTIRSEMAVNTVPCHLPASLRSPCGELYSILYRLSSVFLNYFSPKSDDQREYANLPLAEQASDGSRREAAELRVLPVGKSLFFVGD